MKADEQIQVLKNQPARPAHAPGGRPPRLLRWIKIFTVVVLTAACTYWLCDNVFLSRVPTELLGKWAVTEGEFDGLTMEFRRNGTLHIEGLTEEGLPRTDVAEVHLDDDMLITTLYVPAAGTAPPTLWRRIVSVFWPGHEAKLNVAQRILELTPMVLVLEDEDGKLIKMHRAN